jgi:hypothetical protein
MSFFPTILFYHPDINSLKQSLALIVALRFGIFEVFIYMPSPISQPISIKPSESLKYYQLKPFRGKLLLIE